MDGVVYEDGMRGFDSLVGNVRYEYEVVFMLVGR